MDIDIPNISSMANASAGSEFSAKSGMGISTRS